MAVFPGSTFQRSLPGGQSVTYTVRAVRFAPVPYAEVEPVGGGAREALSMWTVESNCQYLWIGVFQATSVSVC
ncbi:hypothetical protein D2E81_04945 [Mycobacteroides abscessus]|uniref:hypothetical protein n=1 Tax=Mycobacteroides abscessus TaxID=36809 RepID=UPI000E69E5F2|nr:hypothetical protein [Mycobacteroides abscessus]RIT25930.1 hypothetical protein D2E81_04945 [Mycobacteroides abscessus]